MRRHLAAAGPIISIDVDGRPSILCPGTRVSAGKRKQYHHSSAPNNDLDRMVDSIVKIFLVFLNHFLGF